MKQLKKYKAVMGDKTEIIIAAYNLDHAKNQASFHKYVNNIRGVFTVKWIKPAAPSRKK